MSAPLSKLELRLEGNKRISNLCLEFLYRLYDRRTISELDCAGDVDLHIHFSEGGMWCATYWSADAVKIPVIRSGVYVRLGMASNIGKFPVFVSIGKISESFSPVTSHVRLQPLDCCYMGGIDTLEPSRLPPLESLFRVFDRKLCSVLRAARIQFGEFKDEIIEGASEIVTNFTDKNPDTHGHKSLSENSKYRIVRRIRIELNGNRILLLPSDCLNSFLQISKVFVCPPYSFETAVERMTQIIAHPIPPRKAR